MPEPKTEVDHPNVDPEHHTDGKPFDTSTGYSGQGYSLAKEQEMGRRNQTGDSAKVDHSGDEAEGRDIPPEVGRRAWFDPTTGEAHGGGSGAGPDGADEDFDSGTAGA